MKKIQASAIIFKQLLQLFSYLNPSAHTVAFPVKMESTCVILACKELHCCNDVHTHVELYATLCHSPFDQLKEELFLY